MRGKSELSHLDPAERTAADKASDDLVLAAGT